MRLKAQFRKNTLSSTGDTIVEVLIAIAIVSSVLAGAFSVSQKSSRAVRDSQEHAEMLQLLQGQVELVRAIAVGDTTSDKNIFSPPSTRFCLDNTNSPVAVVSYPATPVPPANSATFPHECTGINSLYNIAISYDGTSTFHFMGWWDKLGGGTNRIDLSYKISPSS
jgi:type II secretory pathway pseudopilin PulG